MTKRFLILLAIAILIGVFVLSLSAVLAQENVLAEKTIKAYLFYGETCPHCKKEIAFLEKIGPKYPELQITKYEVYSSQENASLLGKLYDAYGKKGQQLSVPSFFIDDQVIIGYLDDKTTGQEIEDQIKGCTENKCLDPLKKNSPPEPEKKKINNIIPTIFGNFDISTMSLPVLTVVIGTLDGFNPCAMWVLVLLLALLINLRDRKKMLLIGGTFLAASGIVYFLILAAWLNLFIYIGYISITRIVIGVVAIGVGIWQLKSFMSYQKGVCKVTSVKDKWHQKMIDKIKQITQPASLPITLAGIVVLAFAVNLLEFFCSAGLPAIYTRVLTLSNLNPVSYYLYLLLYIVFFMIDDAIVFIIALITFKKIGFTDKYSRFSTLVGGLIIFLLGILLIFFPGLLMFGS